MNLLLMSQDLLDEQRRVIEERGFSLMANIPLTGGVAHVHTVGLTRCDGHPELLISGWDMPLAKKVLESVVADVRAGARVSVGDEMRFADATLAATVIRVNEPRRLVVAQEVYASLLGPVPALQLVWASKRDRWPWQREWCPVHDGEQELFGGLPAQRSG